MCQNEPKKSQNETSFTLQTAWSSDERYHSLPLRILGKGQVLLRSLCFLGFGLDLDGVVARTQGGRVV